MHHMTSWTTINAAALSPTHCTFRENPKQNHLSNSSSALQSQGLAQKLMAGRQT